MPDTDPLAEALADLSWRGKCLTPAHASALADSARRCVERIMFGSADGGLVSDASELPVGELRRLLWEGEAPDA